MRLLGFLQYILWHGHPNYHYDPAPKAREYRCIDCRCIKGFVKEGKNNRLRARDIKKITDAVINRTDEPKFSRKVERDEIRKNEYNLNIPRYVDSSDDAESWDIYASMFGGIPNSEIDGLSKFWDAFPSLRNQIFKSDDTPYSSLAVEDIKQTITDNVDVKSLSANSMVRSLIFRHTYIVS